MAIRVNSVVLWGGLAALAFVVFYKRKEIEDAAPVIGENVTRIVNRVVSTLTRGFRNNNPLNIRKGNNWQGETSVSGDSAFESFIAPEYGYRAGAKLLDNYRDVYGLNTVRGIVEKFAPPNENPTGKYVSYVADKMGVMVDQPIDTRDNATMYRLLEALTRFENGGLFPYERETVMAGIRLARGQVAYA